MFKKATFFSLVISSALLFLWAINFCLVSEKDLAKYATSFEKKEKITASSETLRSSTHQIRQKVQKDIWFAENAETRLHYRIQSAVSLLTLEPKGSKIEVIENLEKIRCWMQDKVYLTEGNKPMQQLRFFEADQGTYRYNTSEFDAKTVMLSLFRKDGHELPLEMGSSIKNAFMKGVAKDVSFSVSGKSPKFQAKQFQASLKPTAKGD